MDEKQSVWKEFQEHLMTGISYMIPVIVPAGIIMGIGIMIGQFIGVDANSAKLLTSSDSYFKIHWLDRTGSRCRNDGINVPSVRSIRII